MKKRINKILWHGDDLLEGKAKAPSISVKENGLDGLNEGELYISNNEKDPALFIRTSSGKIVRVGVNYDELKKMFLSKTSDDTAAGLIAFNRGIALPAGEKTTYKNAVIGGDYTLNKAVYASEDGMYGLGDLIDCTGVMASPFISLSNAAKVDVGLIHPASDAVKYGLVFFDKDQKAVSGIYLNGSSADGYTPTVVDVPFGATQIRVSIWADNQSEFYMRLGYAEPTEYNTLNRLIKADDIGKKEEFTDESVMSAAAFSKLFSLQGSGTEDDPYWILTPYDFASTRSISTKGAGFDEPQTVDVSSLLTGWTKGFGVSTLDDSLGLLVEDERVTASKFIGITDVTMVKVSLLQSAAESTCGLVFYDSEANPIEGHSATTGSVTGYETRDIAVPEGAKTLRVTKWADTVEHEGYFSLILIYDEDAVNGGAQSLSQLNDVLAVGDEVAGADEGNVLTFDGTHWKGEKVSLPSMDESTEGTAEQDVTLVKKKGTDTWTAVPVTEQVEGDKHYVHTQGTVSKSWVIAHNLNKFPSVTVVDSFNTSVYGEVVYDSLSQLTINFSATFSGKAFLN